MGLKLYYAPYSTANATVAVLTELEAGLSEPLAERIEVSLQKGDTKTPEFLAEVNPNGLIPTIVHDGVSIWESAAIAMYLGETFGVDRPVDDAGAKQLYPPPGTKRGEAMKWIVWGNTHLSTMGSRLHAAQCTEAPVEGDKKKAHDALMKELDVMNKALQDKDYLVGTYTLADTHIWSFMGWLTMLKVNLAEVPNVKAWYERVGGRATLKGLF